MLQDDRSRTGLSTRVARVLRCTGASATIECAFGVVALVVVTSATLAVYTAVQTRVSLGRANVALADHLSRGGVVASADLMRIAEFLADVDQHARADVVHIASALHNPPGPDGTKVLWSHGATRIGAPETTRELAAACSRRGSVPGGPTINGEPITLAEGKRIIVVESCARVRGVPQLTAAVLGTIAYRVHVTPFRPMTGPLAPPT